MRLWGARLWLTGWLTYKLQTQTTNSLKMFCWQNGRAGNEAVWLRNISLTADCRPKTLLENNTGPSSLIVSHCLGKLKMSTNQPASAYWQGSPPDQSRATTVPFGKWVGRKVAVRWRWIIKSSSNLQDTAQTGQMTVPDDSQRIEDHHYILCLLQPPSWTWLASYLSKLGVIKPILPLTARPVMLSPLLPDFHRKKNNRKNWLQSSKNFRDKEV